MGKKYVVAAGLVAMVVGAVGMIANSLALTVPVLGQKNKIAFTCWMDYGSDGDAVTSGYCFGGTDSAYGDARPGDFPVIIRGANIDDMLWSDLNAGKFLADEELVRGHIDAQNANIDLYLDLAKGINVNGWDVDYTEDDPYIVGIKEFVATLENGRVTDVDELLSAMRVLQVSPPMMDLRLSELEENFDVAVVDYGRK